METHTETQTYIETHGQAVSILYASGRGRTRRRWPITAYTLTAGSAKGRVVELDLEDRPSVHARAGKTAWLGDGGWDSGRTRNCLTHALPRYLPTPNSMEAWRRMEEGSECCSRAERSLGPPSGAGDRPRPLVPLGRVDRPVPGDAPTIRPGGPTRTSPSFGAKTRRVFPDHLIT